MKILMRNVGMTLHVIHTLRDRGIENVQVNMDWQHLIMNGESLAEYAALLADIGLLGHQHANYGWGTFDDDNMVGTTASWRRSSSRSSCGASATASTGSGSASTSIPTPRTPSPRCAAACCNWRFIDGRRCTHRRRRRCARPRRARTRSGRTSSSTPRSARLTSGGAGADALVGLDVGTTGVKALVAVAPDGRVLARREHGYPLSTPRPGWAEQDPADWWARPQLALEELGGLSVLGIGLSGQMHGLVVLDADDTVLRPAILWNDQRTEAECREIEERIGLERLIALTGNRALTGFTAPKLLWLRHTSRRSTTASRTCCCRRTTSACGSPASMRSTSRTRRARCSSTSRHGRGAARWSRRSRCPRLVAACPRVAGGLGPDAGGVPVAAGAGDQAAAALGVGVDRPGPLSVVLGTSGVVFAALPGYAADPQARVHVFCHAVPGTWEAMGVMLSAAGSLQLAADVARRRTAPCSPPRPRGWQPGAEGLLFAPYLAGERTPHADPNARGAFVGLSLRHDRGALARAVLEGVAYGLRDSLELLRELGVGRPSRARRAAARGARSGSRSSRRCSGCRSSGPRSRRDRRSVRRCSAASPRVSSRRRRGGRGLRPRP